MKLYLFVHHLGSACSRRKKSSESIPWRNRLRGDPLELSTASFHNLPVILGSFTYSVSHDQKFKPSWIVFRKYSNSISVRNVPSCLILLLNDSKQLLVNGTFRPRVAPAYQLRWEVNHILFIYAITAPSATGFHLMMNNDSPASNNCLVGARCRILTSFKQSFCCSFLRMLWRRVWQFFIMCTQHKIVSEPKTLWNAFLIAQAASDPKYLKLNKERKKLKIT